jgi:hypothetical protein
LAWPVRPVRSPVRSVPSEPTTLRSSYPLAEHDCCSTILFVTCSLLGTIWSVELADDFSIVGFSVSSVKSEFLFNLPSFWHDRLVWSPCDYFSVLTDSYDQNNHYA